MITTSAIARDSDELGTAEGHGLRESHTLVSRIACRLHSLQRYCCCCYSGHAVATTITNDVSQPIPALTTTLPVRMLLLMTVATA